VHVVVDMHRGVGGQRSAVSGAERIGQVGKWPVPGPRTLPSSLDLPSATEDAGCIRGPRRPVLGYD